MAVSNRGAALAGNEIVLRAVFTDSDGCLVDLDAVPEIYIYDESVETDTIVSEADAQTYTSALVGPLSAVRLSTGYYTYSYTVPAGGDAGSWHDLWVGTINGTDDYDYFSFRVTAGFDASSQSLGNNTMVIIELSGDITNSAGDESLVATDLYYSTNYSPLYASPDLIRLELGRWIDYIPDDTLALMSHISSKEADFIQGDVPCNSRNLKLAKTKFVVYDSVWRCLMIPGQGQQSGYASGKKKSLGDLSITDGAPVVAVPDEIMDWIHQQRQSWFRVVNAGANIVPGQGLTPTYAVKGMNDPDRRLGGRLWEDPGTIHYPQPSANSKRRRAGMRRGRFGFSDGRRRR